MGKLQKPTDKNELCAIIQRLKPSDKILLWKQNRT